MAQIKRKVQILEKQTPKKSKWWLWLLLCVVVVVVAVFFFLKTGSSGNGNIAVQPEATAVSTPAAETTTGTEVTPVSEEAATPATPEGATSPASKPAPVSTPASEPATVPAQSSQPAAKPASAATPLQGTLDEKALKVIRGDFGNGHIRKEKLGSEYQAIQRRVNEMYRDGIFQ